MISASYAGEGLGVQGVGLVGVDEFDAALGEDRFELPEPVGRLVVAVVAEEQDLERLRVVGRRGRRVGRRRPAATRRRGMQRSSGEVGDVVGRGELGRVSARRVSDSATHSRLRDRLADRRLSRPTSRVAARNHRSNPTIGELAVGPDGGLELLDDERPADVALGVRPEQADVQVALGVQVVRVADGQRAGAAGGQVLDRQGVLSRPPGGGSAAGRSRCRSRPTSYRSVSVAVGVVDQELGVRLGPVLARA